MNHNDLPSSPASSYLITSTSFFQSYHIYKRFHLVHLELGVRDVHYYCIVYIEIEAEHSYGRQNYKFFSSITGN